MNTLIAALTGGYSSTAKVVDGTLILSLPDAASPVVWRMDLGQVRSSAIEVRDSADGLYLLTLKTPKDDVHTIAPFHSRAAAVKALMAISRAMEQAHGQLRPLQAAHTDSAGSAPFYKIRSQMTPGKWIVSILAIIAIYTLYTMTNNRGVQTASFPSAPGPVVTAPAQDGLGVPVSADNFLKNR